VTLPVFRIALVCFLAGNTFAASVLTERYDLARSGINSGESILNQTNVTNNFHKVATFNCDNNDIWAEPLVYDSGTGQTLIVATAGGTICAFDATASGSPAPLWSVSAGAPYSGAYQAFGNKGLSSCISTPVIDPVRAVVYAECQVADGSHMLLALNVADGSAFHAPVVVDATDIVSGTQFSQYSMFMIERNGLMLLNGTLFLSYASRNDYFPRPGVYGWNGWIIGFNPTTLAQTVEFCDTCSGSQGGGAGLWGNIASDGTDIFYVSGNGSSGTGQYNIGAGHISATGQLLDWFTPSNYADLNAGDADLTTNIVIFNSSYLIFAGKTPEMFVLNKATGAMGYLQGSPGSPPVVQAEQFNGVHSSFRNSLLATSTDLYTAGNADPPCRWPWTGSGFNATTAAACGSNNTNNQAGQLMYSWDGVNSSSAILWDVYLPSGGYGPAAGILAALDPVSMTQLYSSDTLPSDALGNGPKLSSPTVANGRVYVPTRDGAVLAYGLGAVTATVTLGNLTATYDGTSKSATATTIPPNLMVTFTYNGSSSAPVAAGSYTVIATVNDPNYTGSATGTLVISPATPTITWPAPATITFGTALSATQLNASTGIPGTFVYAPPSGTVLSTGNGQTLSVTFTPTDTTDYTTATATTTINVIPAPLANLVVTKLLTRSNGNIVVQLTIANAGLIPAANVVLTIVRVDGVSGTPLPQNIGFIDAGASAQATVTVPGTVSAAGADTLRLKVTFAGGSFSSTGPITLP